MLFTKKTHALLTALRAVGCVDKFVIVSRIIRSSGRVVKLIRFSVLLYKGKPFFKGVRLVSSPSKKHTISLRALRIAAVSIGSSVIILSTPKGLVSHREAISLGTGGLVLCIVS